MTHNIVVGVDGSDNSFVALNTAADLAMQTDARLSVVLVHDPRTGALAVAYDGGAELYIEQTAAELETTSRERVFHLLADRPVEWTFDVVGGEAAHMLVDVAKARSAWLIIVGGRGHSLLGGLVLGSVAQKLVRSSPISVLVVRHPDVNDHQLSEQRQSTRSSPPLPQP
ncbi:MAG: universal stress protein UspA [Actinomycetia bacterium]|nr:universal stress protein UspA [Actinomycetes bacterium]